MFVAPLPAGLPPTVRIVVYVYKGCKSEERIFVGTEKAFSAWTRAIEAEPGFSEWSRACR